MESSIGVIILAGTSGSRLFPISEGVAKAVLPAGNRAIISYLLGSLQRSGVDGPVVVVTTSRFEDCVRTALGENAPCVVVVDEMLGSAGAVAEAFRQDPAIALCRDVLVLAGECAVGWRSLKRLLDTHRIRESACTAVYAQGARDTTKKSKRSSELEIVALGARSVVFEMRTISLEDEDALLPFSKALLKLSPRLEVRCDLVDIHCYAFDAAMLRKRVQADPTAAIRADILPALCNAYLRSADNSIHKDEAETKEMTSLRAGPYDRYLAAVSAVDPFSGACINENDNAMTPSHLNSIIGPVVALIIKEDEFKAQSNENDDDVLGADLAVRINTVPVYTTFCRHIVSRAQRGGPVIPNGKVLKRDGTLLGNDINLADKVHLKNATLGARCSIGAKAKINNSVLFDGVIVHDGAVVQNSIICAAAEIKEKANLNDVLVGANAQVAAGSVLKNEIFMAEDEEEQDEVPLEAKSTHDA